MLLTGQIALVTGASRGIGQAIAKGMGEAGATVIGTATSQSGADNITAYLSEAGIKGKGLMLDVSDAESITICLKQLTDEFGTIDILINNAGITRDGLLMAMKEDQWDAIINTNLSSIFRMSKAVVRGMMKKRNGRIISISSVVGATGNPGQTNYAAAKAGLVGFSKSLAREIGSRNITVNTVAPGLIDTDMTKELGGKQKDDLLGQIPLGRLGSAQEIAATVVFLSSPAAAYITGETIHVNGGMYMA